MLFLLFFLYILINRKILKIAYQKEKLPIAYRKLEESKFTKISTFVLGALIPLTIPLLIFADETTKDLFLVVIFTCLYGILGVYLVKKIFKLREVRQ